ncbi:Protein unc-93 A [Araneus ventricosus]|uniref:Protein unc-93 A n=1 Tax=Araneus ventricosus TaxID=182803 RepID=A0A4Y2CCD8_ARAVE|nr:Protein unc-93 A [Araneus ventricosus]
MDSGEVDATVIGGEESYKTTRRSAMRNLFILCLCYFLVGTGSWALSNIQSSMNTDATLRSCSQLATYASAMISALLLPKWSIQKIGCKTVLTISFLASFVQTLSNISVCPETTMLASLIFGLTRGPHAVAQSLYIKEMAVRFQEATCKNLDTTLGLFFGIFVLSVEISRVCGSLISCFVLKIKTDISEGHNISVNFTCGVEFLFEAPENERNINLIPSSTSERILLIAVLSAMSLFAVLLAQFLLEPIERQYEKKSDGCIVCDSLKNNLRRLKDVDQLLLIPFSVILGLLSSFFSYDVTEVSEPMLLLPTITVNVTILLRKPQTILNCGS